MAALLIMGSSCWDVFAADNRIPVAVSADSKVPLRILTRPGAVLYADAEGTKVLKSNVPTFSSYFVYTRPKGEAAASGEGWYEIGSDDRGSVKGWMKGNDLFEWKQTMCLTFSHPDGRSPVLMFDDEDILNTLIGMSEDDRTAKVDGYYSEIDQAAAGKKKLSRDFPVLSVEPKMAVDNADNFTLMPIVDYKVVEFEGRESRLLDIVAVNSTEKDRKASDIRENKEYLTSSNTTSESKSKDLKDMKYDIVWVVDTTRSMGPYIEKVREIMNRVSGEIAKNKSFGDKVAFGVWGYRDSATIEGLEYVTNNFTPELQNAQDFAETIGKVKAEKIKEINTDIEPFAEKAYDWIMKYISIVSIVALLLFSGPLYLLFRKNKGYPDMSFSEFFVAMVYSMNMLEVYSIVTGFLCLNVMLEPILYVLIIIPIKQLSGYSYWRTLLNFVIAMIMFLVMFIVVMIVVGIIVAVYKVVFAA